MVLYNTMTRKKEELTYEGEKLGIYVCGPTVYNYIHIGNARTYCLFDTFRRYLAWRGVPVKFVSNLTDIDDRIIAGAAGGGITVKEFAERFIKEYQTDCASLNILPPDEQPRATESISLILDMIDVLIKKGYAYAAQGGDVYFRTKRFEEYGKLSRQNLDELEEGVRIEPGELKEDPLDFALWKAAKPGEPGWSSPYGEGRPGWHIECSAMAGAYLDGKVDIHGGGLDLIFPHHENEIAQSECSGGGQFSRYWMHVSMLNFDNRKMSKSLGNFFTVRDISAEYGYELIRYYLISAHYRSQMNFTRGILESFAVSLDRLKNCRYNLERAVNDADGAGEELAENAKLRKEQFIQAMDDDFNTADAIAALFEFARDINSAEKQSKQSLEYAAKVFDQLCSVLGILAEKEQEDIPEQALELLEARQTARSQKDYKKADEIREAITALGYTVEDTKDGPVIKKL